MGKLVFTNGCFDILHPGHIKLLEYCSSLGKVVVGLNSDESVKKLKGPNRPFNNQVDRKFMLESCKFVSSVHIFNEETPYKLIKDLEPDFIVKGGDYKPNDVVGCDLATVLIFDYIDGYSTTKTIENTFSG